MSKIFHISLDEAQSFIDHSVSEGKFKDLFSFLDSRNILAFADKNTFERFLDLLLYINNKNYDASILYFILIKLLYKENKEQISEKYAYEDQEYLSLITSKLRGNYSLSPNNITKSVGIGILNNEFIDEIIWSKEDILQISKEALDNLIENDNQVKQRHIDLLYSCISDIHQVTRIVTLDNEACEKIRRLIVENPAGYFDNFVRLGMITFNKDFNSVACEPFWMQLFGNAGSFKSFINGLDETSVPKIKLVKNFWTLYKNNGYKPIEFQNQGNVQEKIDNNLTNEVDKFSLLLKIENEFDQYEMDRSNTPRKKDNEFYLKQYQRLLNHIDSIGLFIAKTGEIKRKIQTIISSISRTTN
jgi:hypothetical protein